MASTPKHRISRVRRRGASAALVLVAVVLMATGLAAHLAGAARAFGATQQSNAPRLSGGRSVPIPPWTLTTLYSFTGGANGAEPLASLIRDASGNLYGTTAMGGSDGNCGGGFLSGCGIVFKFDTAGNETVLYTFTGGADGGGPSGDLIHDGAGNLYGTTVWGGDLTCPSGGSGCGVVFKLDSTGAETVLYAFTGGTDGTNPEYGVIHIGTNLYGTTSSAGDASCNHPFGCGVVFRLDTAGNETVLHSFTGGADGKYPTGSLIHDGAGSIYGVTYNGGPSDAGVVFKLDTSGNETALYSFAGGTDGGYPSGGLVHDTAGNLYGMTAGGGDLSCNDEYLSPGCGTVYRLDSAGNEIVLHNFTLNGVDGVYPGAGLIQDARGDLYGVTYEGGVNGFGVIFKLDRNGKETVLHSFAGGADGAYPGAGLTHDGAGNLYGTTIGNTNLGTVFRLTP